MSYIAQALRDRYLKDQLHILVAKTNSNTFTYDGIEVGAERVTQEIESYIKEIEIEGGVVRKLSVVGYSLGGLVARYVIGLLYSNGWFDRIEPINFTTFATPHLGVRTPLLGVHNRVWNILGSRTLSVSGRQLFTIDRFRDTDRSLLSVLADPSSVFILALSKFNKRVLYCNIINDSESFLETPWFWDTDKDSGSAPYYTTCISTVDQFTDLDAVKINYIPEYSPNILDPTNPVVVKSPDIQPPLYTRLVGNGQTLLTRFPLFALLFVMVPVGVAVFLINSGVQSVRSQKRIKMHEEGRAGIGLGSYRIPLMVDNARNAMEGAFGNMNSSQRQAYLPVTDSDDSEPVPESDTENVVRERSVDKSRSHSSSLTLKRTSSRHDDFPTLALTDEQFAMVEALNAVGFRKHRVHVQKVRHSHAAIIVRKAGAGYDEGKTVMRHWLKEEFEI